MEISPLQLRTREKLLDPDLCALHRFVLVALPRTSYDGQRPRIARVHSIRSTLVIAAPLAGRQARVGEAHGRCLCCFGTDDYGILVRGAHHLLQHPWQRDKQRVGEARGKNIYRRRHIRYFPTLGIDTVVVVFVA